jgi:hypothetical protein
MKQKKLLKELRQTIERQALDEGTYDQQCECMC